MLHVAVDAHDLTRDRRGIGTYVRALLERFARRDDVRLTLLVRGWFPRRFAAGMRMAIRADRAATIGFSGRVPREADVVWHPWNGTFFNALGPNGAAVPAVATLHDVIPFAAPAADQRRRRSQQEPFERSARSARAIVCDSRFTAGEARRFLAIEPARLRVVPLGVDPVFAPGDDAALPAALRGVSYLLYVGAHDPTKNTLTLAAAYRTAFAAYDDVALVFTRPNPLIPEALVFENVDVPTLVALYRAAWCVAVPSTYEGFGLPVLEAMACGAPVLASRAASLPEVGGDAVAYVDSPLDVEAWRAALHLLRADDEYRTELARRGPPRATLFTWDACAQRTLDVLREVASAG